MPRIAVVGSANMDLVVTCDHLPRPGETVIGTDFAIHPGGKGANQAVAAGRMANKIVFPGEGEEENEVFFVGCLGDDAYGERLLDSLDASYVGTTHVKRTSEAPTGTALITVNQNGENTIVIDSGANAYLSAEDVTKALTEIKPDVVLVQLEIPDDAVYACAGHGKLILDPAPARILDTDFMAKVAFITPNESETLYLTGLMPTDEFSQYRAAQSLAEKGPKCAIITLGANGVYCLDKSEQHTIKAPKVEAVDTTAAGDAFAGALAVMIAEGNDTKTAIETAVKSAAVSVTRHGAQPSMPTRDEVSRLSK